MAELLEFVKVVVLPFVLVIIGFWGFWFIMSILPKKVVILFWTALFLFMAVSGFIEWLNKNSLKHYLKNLLFAFVILIAAIFVFYAASYIYLWIKEKNEIIANVLLLIVIVFVVIKTGLISSFFRASDSCRYDFDLTNVSMYELEQSTAIAYCGYDDCYDYLVIVFRSNEDRTYVYEDVPEEVYKELLNADSPGSYFNTNIRDQYEFERYDYD